MATLLHKNLCPRGDEFHNFYKPFLNYHYYTLSLTEACPRVDKTIFKEIQQFYTFYPRITFPWGGGMKLVFLPYRCFMQNLAKIGPLVLEKKMFTNDARWTNDNNRGQTIVIGHLSDSG